MEDGGQGWTDDRRRKQVGRKERTSKRAKGERRNLTYTFYDISCYITDFSDFDGNKSV